MERAGITWKEVIKMESDVLEARVTRAYLTQGGRRRGVLTIYQGVLPSITITASEVPVQELKEEKYKPGKKEYNYF